jgi:uncharacterized protein (DUF2126 family)/transglutaminase-like putative cysteine protease
VSIHVALHHLTHYRYDRPVTLGPQVVRLRPAPHCRSRILAYSLTVQPAEHFVNWQQDPEANYLARLTFPNKARELRIEVDLVAEMSVFNPFDFFLEPHAEQFPFAYADEERSELAPYLATLPRSPRFNAYLATIARRPTRTVDFLVELNTRLARDIRYVIRLEPGVQSPEETLVAASGSCRDSSWLLVQLLRHLGLAARFVSGYLIQLVPDVKSLDGPSGASADFTDLHAWCEVYLPGAGWIGLDPTSGLLAGEGHLPLACTPEPSSAAPVSGLVETAEVTFEHRMTVERVWEAPRVTRPYTEPQWAAVERLGAVVDADLAALDVRLTMGGEPTFVSSEDPDGAEWNTTALGPRKRRLALDLFKRLKEHYAPAGLAHFGQGKWYPGEPLPRWSLNCFWRRDGEPIWRNPALIAEEPRDGVAVATFVPAAVALAAAAPAATATHAGPAPHVAHAAATATADDTVSAVATVTPVATVTTVTRVVAPPATAEVARRFLDSLATRLGLAREYVFEAYEDAFYYLWRERRLPGNVDPLDSRLADPIERARLAALFERGLDPVVGYVLPLARDASGLRWQTSRWFLRAERCYLVPGDSPLGLRLPLDSLPWARELDRPFVAPPDPTQAFAPLPSYVEIRRQVPGTGPATEVSRSATSGDVDASTRPPRAGESAASITRTALCAEPRAGVLYVFMPPTPRLEDYLELVSAVEATAAELAQPVILEGYEPPRDPRLTGFRLTPDPGVIEVNVQPSSSWDELVALTTRLYDTARLVRLTSEKFMVDGRHTGTGGGNHFVLGGATTVDSPFLRRPDLLRSLLAYWHNHPSLSYLFSGLFIGPTSQAPRTDEARNDANYELEIAFGEIPPPDTPCPPWLTDRVFRNLLIDVTGNTHRAEFCIDKLYSPDGPTGRLGLLELRAFEMPPHARMSLTQQLLLRALVARFWRKPYLPARLVRWGTELHDRFMLPYFIEQDFADVLAELGAAGFAFAPEWFAPHFEFRFPKYGDFATRGIAIELRQALEPWHVMGEEGTAGGAVRYVDSSVERLQVRVTGLAPDRYLIACNGRTVPLRPTGTVGEFVAGVRYRAWKPPSALHPTVGVDAPLTFDLVDTWMERSLGGCRYHVAHPGGRSYETFPVNAYESESRRLGRFERMGYTPGLLRPGAAVPSPEFPFTLDLRRS